MAGWNVNTLTIRKWKPLLEAFATAEEKPRNMELTNSELSAYQLMKVLENLGYHHVDTDTNGWELDFWLTMVHSQDNYHTLVISGCGMTQALLLRWGELNKDE